MGVLSFFFFFFFFFFLLSRPLFAYNEPPQIPTPPLAPSKIGDIATSNTSQPPPPPPPPPPIERSEFSPFRPSIAVVVGVLTTMFSLTFLLLLYAKHCKRGNGNIYSGPTNSNLSSTTRKNSGIDRAVIESLPIFRFGSLKGQKDGLECAVCLNRFETNEVLRLLPKCKHAFHVECVDTWLDAHSTCPLCRYRVDPEDILLIGDTRMLHDNQLVPPPQEQEEDEEEDEIVGSVPPPRVLLPGRHSSAGERTSVGGSGGVVLTNPTSFRRSLDSLKKKKQSEFVSVGCFDRPRKDGLLLVDRKKCLDHRLEHQIVVSNFAASGLHQRWSDVQPSDLLFLRSEMILSDNRRFSSGSSSRPSVRRQEQQQQQQHQHQNLQVQLHLDNTHDDINGRSVINTRSVSEITGLSRFLSNSNNNNGQYRNSRGQAGVVSRWLAWISSQSQPDVRSDRTTVADTVV